MRKNLTKGERLKKRSDIGRVFASGRKVSCTGAKLFFRENGFVRNRVAVTLRKHYGSAVERNRAKRVVREAYRNMKPSLKSGYDIVVLLFPYTDTCWRRSKQLSYLCRKADLYAFTSSENEEKGFEVPPA